MFYYYNLTELLKHLWNLGKVIKKVNLGKKFKQSSEKKIIVQFSSVDETKGQRWNEENEQ